MKIDDIESGMGHATDKQIDYAYKECARLTRAASSNFYVAFLSLPKELRRGIYATYAFCRLCDDIVDEPIAGLDPGAELDDVGSALDGARSTKFSDSPIFVALDDAIRRFGLDKQHYVDVIDGCRMDIGTQRYESFDELRVYCRRVASAVGIICISIFGYSDRRAIEYADDLGIAFQLTNILRDVREDYANGRVYLPQTEMQAFGVVEADFVDDKPTDNLRELIRFQLERARGFYESGERVIPLATRGRQCLELMSGFYFRILEKIEENDADVLSRRVSLSTAEKLSITAGTGWRWALRSVAR